MTKRKISPHKGGRSVRKSTDVTPEVARMLAYLWKEHNISLGDLVADVTRMAYTKKHSQDQGGAKS